LGGKLELRSPVGHGTLLTASIPFQGADLAGSHPTRRSVGTIDADDGSAPDPVGQPG
jgi:hypothetical protein